MKTRARRLSTLLTVLAMAFATLPMTGAVAATDDLFFSEYIEGSSFNKAVEIYNGTGAAVDLTAGDYSLEIYFNGSASPGLILPLNGTVADGDVYIVADDGADPAILAQADFAPSVNFFNGDDAVVLRKAGVSIDVIGVIGTDPGSAWGVPPLSTQDSTIRRLGDVCAGDTDGSDAFDPANEWVGVGLDVFDGLGAHTADCDGPTANPPVINEFSASTTGTDVEYVEVFGDPDTDYSAFTILEIEGDGDSNEGTIDEVIPVGSTDADGFWLADLVANTLENGTITLLLVEGFTGTAGDDLDTDDDGALDATPWGAVIDAVAVDDGDGGDLTYGEPALGPNFDGLSTFPPGGASRIPDGTDTNSAADWARNPFSGSPVLGEANNTPGTTNTLFEPPLEACGDPFTFIYDVQGNGLTSPLEDTTVSIEGVVVGDFQDGGFDGFYLQDPTGDGDAATSDGVFVFAPGAPGVEEGDTVRVNGTVAEFFGMTQVSAAETWICATGGSLPEPAEVTLPVTSLDDFEAFEGMRVTLPQSLTISEFFNFDRFGEIVLTTDRQFQPTATFEPGSPEAAALAQANTLSRITLDDGRSGQNQDPAIHPNGSPFDLSNLFRGGDLVTNATGILDFRFGLYKIQPTQGADYTPVNERPAAPPEVGGELSVASFNVLNYFTTLDGSGSICGPGADEGCRGADNADELTRQRDKIVTALSEMDADVFGLIELENTPGARPEEDLVSGVNDILGAGTYAAVDAAAAGGGVVGPDVIRVGIIYKPASVTPIGDPALYQFSLDPLGEDRSRTAVAQTFRENASGALFTVAVNHLKSKSGSEIDNSGGECETNPTYQDCDNGDGSGYFNVTRTAHAAELAEWLATDPTASGDGDFLIIGDLNSYDKEDPIDALRDAGYEDLLATYGGEFAYSYVFNGQLGYLDYGMANASLASQVTGTAAWLINADEADLIDYDTSFKQDAQDAIYAPDQYRSSDHDPVIVGLSLTATPDQAIAALQAIVDQYEEEGILSKGKARVLSIKLRLVDYFIDRDRERVARILMGSFLRTVRLYERFGILSPEEAEPLLSIGTDLRDSLG